MDNSKPYLLTLSSHTSGMSRFLNSLKHIDVEHVGIQFLPLTKEINTYLVFYKPYPGHIQKYAYVPRDLDPERYVIFTDTDDVVFQKELPDFDQFDLYLSIENVPQHKDSWWEQHILDYEDKRFHELLDKPLYCSGTWATKVKTFYQYTDFLEEMGAFHETKHFGDQLYFNLFLLRHPELTRYEGLDLFCSLHANMHRDDVEKVDGVWKYNGEVITCVHANGSLKDHL